jgi:hypothetical protein
MGRDPNEWLEARRMVTINGFFDESERQEANDPIVMLFFSRDEGEGVVADPATRRAAT